MPRTLDASEYTCTRIYEAQAARRGCRLVAGCDEAGRGALLGPLYAAAVILDSNQPISGVDDSKKLSAVERSEFAVKIRAKAIAFQVVAVEAAEVDALNVYEASRVAMIRALQALNPAPDFILTDAMPLAPHDDSAGFPIPYRSIIHGDARSVSIAAASILAKVARDARLEELDRLYPQYLLAKNKGYGTPDHFASLARYGPCPEHRQTFQPVKDYVLPLFPFGGS
ncbi:MAG TPA: ribonuclease HII [Terriglobia bacterium]|nr:ribonuclease HII [Terriglobia bacterium]